MSQQSDAFRPLGASGFAVSRTGVRLRPGTDLRSTTAAAIAAGRSWAVLDGGADPSWVADVDDRLATLLIVDAERSDVLRARVMAAAGALRRFPDGLLLRDAGRLAQERAWPTVAELAEEGKVRCAGLVTTRAAVLERCAAWRSADAVLVPSGAGAVDSSLTALIEACRWSGVAVIVDGEGEDELVVDAPVSARLAAADPPHR